MNFLIKLLGGVTQKDYEEIFHLSNKEREILVSQLEFYQSLLKTREERINWLEDLILKKTGFITSDFVDRSNENANIKPIGGSNTWTKVKARLERQDRKEMNEREAKM